MNKKLKPIIILLFTLLTIGTQAQELSKTEKKSLKKQIRSLLQNPAKYKKLKGDLEDNKEIVKSQLEDITKLNKEKKAVDEELTASNDSIRFYKNKLKAAEDTKASASSNTACKDDSGLKYRVQIGLYKEFDISSFFKETKVTSFELIDDYYRYTIGNFNSEGEAEQFKEAIRQMGINGAFVSYYLDGTRIPKE